MPTDTHMWAQSYDEGLQDTLAFQSKVARDIAEQIRVTLNRQEQAVLVGGRGGTAAHGRTVTVGRAEFDALLQ